MLNTPPANIRGSELKQFLDAIRATYGYDFSGYAESSLKRRLLHFISLHKITGLEQLQKRIIADEFFFESLIREISVTVTEMFRDPSFYKSFRNKVIPRLATYPFIKVWVAGCATGEEAYSLAILLQEESLLSRSIIYATDINQHSLEHARAGIFPLSRMKDYTSQYQQAGGKNDFSLYYKSKYHSVLFDKGLRQHMVFASHNLATDKSFGEFQLIFCRNVLIYFNQHLQNHVFRLFHQSLCNFGYLALGNRESLLCFEKKDDFEEIDKQEKIFRKKM